MLSPEDLTALPEYSPPATEMVLNIQSLSDITDAFEAPVAEQHTSADDALDAHAGAHYSRKMEAKRAVEAMGDGTVTLPDGSTFTKASGEEFGENGYWSKWTVISGVAAEGGVEWEERWWEVRTEGW